MKVSANKFVSAEYELFVDGDHENELELVERATPEKPLNFIYGIGMMLPKFEEQLFGLQKGDRFDFAIVAEDAYGEYDDNNVIDLERTVFEIDGKFDETVIFAGNIVPLMDSEGNRLQAEVVEVSDTHVTVDLNHPLAGDNLHFKGSVLEVHEPTAEEMTALIGGGGCGCGCHECSNDCDCGC